MEGPRCPKCYTPLVPMKLRRGTYLICPNYPNCKTPGNYPQPKPVIRDSRPL
jgi:ssDNA-binding Zn-finger/Zn-ribbon topoisomerase 1